MLTFFWIGLFLILWHMYWLYQTNSRLDGEQCKKTTFQKQLDHYFQNVVAFDHDSICHDNLFEFYKEMFEDTTPYMGSRRHGDNPPDVFYLGDA